ncbi:MAG TPA: glycosyl hydrolase, partial [Firmicutes bacterium]|nr:glycosyl hydrolase [Bacillota bacterium]
VQPNTVIVLHNGSPVEMPWVNEVSAIVEVYLGGQGVGEATVNVLYGEVNPSGKLAETFPIHLEDNPSYLNFPGYLDTVDYREGVYVGYRYYDSKKQDVLFPFGHGLSYTTFEYSNLHFSSEAIKDTDTLDVYVDVTNTGTRAGKEVVQLYVKDLTGVGLRPDKELKNFEKISLLVGETKTVKMTLSKRSFAWFNEAIQDWYCASGAYEILVGSSSRDIRLTKQLHLTSSTIIPFVITPNTLVGDLLKIEALKPYIQQFMAMNADGFEANEAISEEMIMAMIENFPLRAMRGFMGLSNEQLQNMMTQLNAALA